MTAITPCNHSCNTYISILRCQMWNPPKLLTYLVIRPIVRQYVQCITLEIITFFVWHLKCMLIKYTENMMKTIYHITSETRQAALDWLQDLEWSNDPETDDFNELTDTQVVRLLNKHYSTGFDGFLDDGL